MPIITVPDCLGGSPRDVETFFALVRAAPPASDFTLDMSRVTFVCPYGILGLVMAARQLAERGGRPVIVNNMTGQIHSYLERMDLFEVGRAWLQPTVSAAEAWARISSTRNL